MFGSPYDKGPFGPPAASFLLEALLPIVVLGVLAYGILRFARGTSPTGTGSAGAGSSLLEALSVLAIGVLIPLFVGFGIEAFYPSPEPPDEPFGPFGPSIEEEVMMEETVLEDEAEPPPKEFAEKGPPPEAIEQEREFRAYGEAVSEYNRVASPIAVVCAFVVLAVVPLLRLRRVPVIRDGVLLGGVLTLLYGLSLALQADGDVFRFLIVAATLLAVLAAVYLRFRTSGQDS